MERVERASSCATRVCAAGVSSLLFSSLLFSSRLTCCRYDVGSMQCCALSDSLHRSTYMCTRSLTSLFVLATTLALHHSSAKRMASSRRRRIARTISMQWSTFTSTAILLLALLTTVASGADEQMPQCVVTTTKTSCEATNHCTYGLGPGLCGESVICLNAEIGTSMTWYTGGFPGQVNHCPIRGGTPRTCEVVIRQCAGSGTPQDPWRCEDALDQPQPCTVYPRAACGNNC